ncbi:MAG: DEAD/DEAH box helicase family protein [Paludibacteraceae bacterium]|nr:DEAD/DEAH box helicase family protein [Paludibacteraceae bacterium]
MTPEEKARQKIDEQLLEAGWLVLDRKDFSAGLPAVALRETLLKGNLEADYMLFLNGIAVGVIEAKREEIDPSGYNVCEQAATYTRKVPNTYKKISDPLPLMYVSNGEKMFFKDLRDEDSELSEIESMDKPKDVVEKLGLDNSFYGLPTLSAKLAKSLRDCQREALLTFEQSLRDDKRRALAVLATGAGKTFFACTVVYRLLKYTKTKRVLFLVDRNNLGKQAESEFINYKLTENGDNFSNIYGVERLHGNGIDPGSSVVISTIQRLFSMLKGEDTGDDDDEDGDSIDQPIVLPDNPMLPKDYFDLIVIDECHRSIYGNWKTVLDYFGSAVFLGLTATPVEETIAFFQKNTVANYTLEKSIADGVNVAARVYRIKTEATENGGTIKEGEEYIKGSNYTGEKETITSKEDKTYTKTELNRSVINPRQIETILEEYKNKVYTEIFTEPSREPNYEYLPKTLIFALNERHADAILQVARKVFNKSADSKFVQKITYSAGDSNALIRSFRNDKDFRIAITCTLVATGTDVKPLEVLIFMRDVESEQLYMQMKGRGVRTIDDNALRNVTPNATSKDFFVLVDAVGVTEHDHKVTSPLTEKTNEHVTLKQLLELLCHGNLEDERLSDIANRLSRICYKSDEEQKTKFAEIAGIGMKEMALRIYNVLEAGTLPAFIDINEKNEERVLLVKELTKNAKARDYLMELNAGFVNTLAPGEDTLIESGFSKEDAQQTIIEFEAFCEDKKDKIEALEIIYNNYDKTITTSMLNDLENKLKAANAKFTRERMWNTYKIVNPNMVKEQSDKSKLNALTNIISLVRFAYKQTTTLDTYANKGLSMFNLWYGQAQHEITDEQITIMRQVAEYIAANGGCTVSELREVNTENAAKVAIAYGGASKANEALTSLSRFILNKAI